MQYMYDVILRCVRATIVVVVKQWVLHKLSVCVCSPRYPVCSAHAPYCHRWTAPLYNIFPHYVCLMNDTIFESEKLLNTKYVFWSSVQHLSEIRNILRRMERDMMKNVYWSSCYVAFSLVRFQWNLNVIARVSKNPQISNLIKIRLVGDQLFHADGRKDRRTDMTKIIVA